ncbi:MAG: FAD-dependent oxidoreductase, partial [Kiritimatiellae bacterium]|nr:FAD-dependent oxidoreductase [Kiritimatiellia bacterium]
MGFSLSSLGGTTNSADVVVYGSTPGGFCAAIAAAREGASVILLEPTAHIGGMNTGGLSFSDSNQMYRETLMGLFHEWHLRIQQDYEDRGITLPYDVNVKDQSNWSFEPHIAMQITTQMLAEAGVQVLTRHYLESVNRDGTHIESLVTSSNGTFVAHAFVDGSYEGDLMAATGVSWTIGREGTADFGESLAGKRYSKGTMNINGFDAMGEPLPLITTTNAGPVDAGDDNIMTYSYRLSLTTDAANRIPMPAPDNYDPARFEIMRRYVLAGGTSIGFDRYSVPGSKVDGNNSIGSQFSLGLVGGAKGWATADEVGRAVIFEAHKQYTLEFLYFLSNDPVFTASQRASIAAWGLCADEFLDTDHFSPYLYVRESRRMQGMYVLKQSDILDEIEKPDPIMISSFPIDSHDCQRVALPDGGVSNEGTIYPVRQSTRIGYPYQVPYRAILPLPAECDNLLVPVALSCTHVAISSLRIEATWMLLGQSAGVAAALAVDQDVAVQDLPYEDLKSRLISQGQVLELPEGYPPEPLSGIILDDPDAELLGSWSTSTTKTPYVGDGYRYAGLAGTPNDGSAEATFRFTATTGGIYQLNMAYSPDPTRATNVLLSVTSGPYVTNFIVDQTVARPDGSTVRPIGAVQLVSGAESVITLSSTGTTGFVILDAIQLLRDTPVVESDATNTFQEGVSPTAAYTHDAVMIRSRIDTNADNTNQNEAGAIIIGLAASGNEIMRGLFEFDISAIRSDSSIASVSLVLTTLSSSGGVNDVGAPGAYSVFNVYKHAFDIDETTATWNVPGGGAPAGG